MKRINEPDDGKRHIVTMTVAELKRIFAEVLIDNYRLTGYSKQKEVIVDVEAKKLISKRELAKNFGVCVETIDKWSRLGILPKPIKIGGRVYFSQQSLDLLGSAKSISK